LGAFVDSLEALRLAKDGAPSVPASLEDTGVTSSLVEQLICKLLYVRGETMGRDMASALGLEFSLIESLLDQLKRTHAVGVSKSLGMGSSSAVFGLTDSGRATTREYLENNQYVGPVPVPLAQYAEQVRRQKLKNNWLNPATLAQAFQHLVVERDILAKIGPAVNSNKSFLLYGQPGNGKTALAEALFNIASAPIYIPFALEYQGNIIQVYDPIYHTKLEEEKPEVPSLMRTPGYDHRWFRTKRPFIVSGGELSLDMLDLTFNKVSKVYDAPFQVKANNGIYLIDDFGRQKASPADVLNRWIVPMERQVDYLNLQSGGKVTVPFAAFLIFSTNLRPEQLGDEAFLRRIQYKMFLRSPGRDEYKQIFERFTASQGLECEPGLLDRFIQKHYVDGGKRYRRCHPRDIIHHAIDIIHFESLPRTLTPELLDHAFNTCFVENVDVND
jgi:predicted ATPase with chaperone activity